MIRAILASIVTTLIATAAIAADDPSIAATEKKAVQAAMKSYIEGLSDKRGFPIFDHTAKQLVRLKLDELHSGVVKKGDLYVSCADFVSPDGTKYDLDFLVQPDGSTYEVVSSLVHSKNGEKSAYDVVH